MKTIHRYLAEDLHPILSITGISPLQEDMVFADISQRLASIFRNWADLKFRQATLLPGVELAEFYRPKTADLEVRALVVVGVRNSMIEELHTMVPWVPEFKARPLDITEEMMAGITESAVRFFARELGNAINDHYSSGDDLFRTLENKYPRA